MLFNPTLAPATLQAMSKFSPRAGSAADLFRAAARPMPIALALMEVAADVRARAIRGRRVAAGLTIEEAAHRAGVSVSTWNNLENPQHPAFRPRTLRSALEALEISRETTVKDTSEESLARALTTGEEDLEGQVRDEPVGDQDLGALIDVLAQLSPEDREIVLGLANRLLHRHASEDQ